MPRLNEYGLTLEEWMAAATWNVPADRRVPEEQGRHAWAAGEDPTEYCAAGQGKGLIVRKNVTDAAMAILAQMKAEATREARRLEMLARIANGEDPISKADYKSARIDAVHTILGSLIADHLVHNVGGSRLWPSLAGWDFLQTATEELEAKAAVFRAALANRSR